MRVLFRLSSLWRNLAHPHTVERDLDEEVRAIHDLLEGEQRHAGRDAATARRLASLELGGVERVKERVREARIGTALDGVRHDLRYALRTLKAHWPSTLVAIVSIALGIGATTAGLSATDGLLWSPYPYQGADRMAIIKLSARSGPFNPYLMTTDHFRDLMQAGALDGGVIWDAFWMSTTTGGGPEAVRTGKLSPNAFDFFGVPPLLGRTFAGEFLPNSESEALVVLSHDYWHTRYAGSPDVLGRTLELDQRDYTIIGVMPARFRFLDSEVYVPLPRTPGPYFSIVRLKPGAALNTSATSVETIVHRQAQAKGYADWKDLHIQLASARDEALGNVTGALRVLLAAVGMLLLIGCLNVSILLLARGITRRHELAVRASVGASDRRLVQQLLTEALLLSISGAAVGIMLGRGLLGAIVLWLPPRLIPPDIQLHLNNQVVVITSAIALLTGLAAALWPAMRSSYGRLSLARQFWSRGTDHRTNRAHALLLMIQVATAFVLLAGAGAALRTYVSLTSAPLGYDPHHVTVLTLTLRDGSYPTWSERVGYYDQLRERVADIAGVESVAISSPSLQPPLVPDRTAFDIPGRETTNERVLMQAVSEEYFHTLRIPLRRGQIWTSSDTRRPAPLGVINETMARQYWPATDPLGQRIRLGNLRRSSAFQVDSPGNDQWVEIVGVVGDARNNGLHAPSVPAIYVPYTLLTTDGLVLLARSSIGQAFLDQAAKRQITSVDAGQPILTTYTLDDRLWEAGWAREQFVGWLFAICAGLALLLAAVGLYSVVACAVAERTREYGLRRALGASWTDIIVMVLRSVGVSVALGLAGGVILTALLDRPIARWTDGSLWDARSVVAAVLVLACVGLGAVVIPALRATRVGPMDALRAE